MDTPDTSLQSLPGTPCRIADRAPVFPCELRCDRTLKWVYFESLCLLQGELIGFGWDQWRPLHDQPAGPNEDVEVGTTKAHGAAAIYEDDFGRTSQPTAVTDQIEIPSPTAVEEALSQGVSDRDAAAQAPRGDEPPAITTAPSPAGADDDSAHQISDDIVKAAGRASKAIVGLNLGHAHLCGRMRFYISVLRGEWTRLPQDRLADVMAEDLKNAEELHRKYFQP